MGRPVSSRRRTAPGSSARARSTAAGTGGTITGTGRYLKERNPKIRIVGVDPLGSLLYETHKLGRVPDDPHPKTYKTEGIGEDFIPSTINLDLLDDIVRVDDKECFLMARDLVRLEGLFVGGSSGAVVAGAVKYLGLLGLVLTDEATRGSSAVAFTGVVAGAVLLVVAGIRVALLDSTSVEPAAI